MTDSPSPTTSAARHLAAQRRRVAHTCAVCGQPFVGVVQAKYCSQRCAQRADYQRHAPARRAERLARYHTRRQETPNGQ